MVAHEVVQGETALADLQRQRRPRERLAHRVDETAATGPVGCPVALRDPMAVALDDQAVRLGVVLDCIEEPEDPSRTDSLR